MSEENGSWVKQSRAVLEGLEVGPAAMRRNIDMTHGLVLSEAVMMDRVLATLV